MEEFVILVDVNGNHIGLEEKLLAHKKGLLHKAFSVFIFDYNNNILLQKRAKDKYHFAGLWSNACCSHPRIGESTIAAAHRRLYEELGFDTDLVPEFTFIYKAKDSISGLSEYEYDEVFSGVYNDSFKFQTIEVEEILWISRFELEKKIKDNPEQFTFWFLKAFEMFKTKLNK